MNDSIRPYATKTVIRHDFGQQTVRGRPKEPLARIGAPSETVQGNQPNRLVIPPDPDIRKQLAVRVYDPKTKVVNEIRAGGATSSSASGQNDLTLRDPSFRLPRDFSVRDVLKHYEKLITDVFHKLEGAESVLGLGYRDAFYFYIFTDDPSYYLVAPRQCLSEPTLTVTNLMTLIFTCNAWIYLRKLGFSKDTVLQIVSGYLTNNPEMTHLGLPKKLNILTLDNQAYSEIIQKCNVPVKMILEHIVGQVVQEDGFVLNPTAPAFLDQLKVAPLRRSNGFKFSHPDLARLHKTTQPAPKSGPSVGEVKKANALRAEIANYGQKRLDLIQFAAAVGRQLDLATFPESLGDNVDITEVKVLISLIGQEKTRMQIAVETNEARTSLVRLSQNYPQIIPSGLLVDIEAFSLPQLISLAAQCRDEIASYGAIAKQLSECETILDSFAELLPPDSELLVRRQIINREVLLPTLRLEKLLALKNEVEAWIEAL